MSTETRFRCDVCGIEEKDPDTWLICLVGDRMFVMSPYSERFGVVWAVSPREEVLDLCSRACAQTVIDGFWKRLSAAAAQKLQAEISARLGNCSVDFTPSAASSVPQAYSSSDGPLPSPE